MAEARLTEYIEELHGNLGAFNIRTTRDGIVFAKKVRPYRREPTPEQITAQNHFANATRNWQNLTDAQRDAWQLYASTYFLRNRDGNGAGPSGQAVYTKAAWHLQAAGFPMPSHAPLEPPPPRPGNVIIESALNQNELRITVHHPVTTVAGYRLHVEITPRLISAARKPHPTAFRAIAGIGPQSRPPLQEDGQTYTFNPIRFAMSNNDRFGIRALIISPGGIPSQVFSATRSQVVM